MTSNFFARVSEQVEKNNVFSIHALPIDGRDVMDALGLEPGPQVGSVLRWLLEKLENDPHKNNREEALAMVTREFGNR